jgi:hypothetical protein
MSGAHSAQTVSGPTRAGTYAVVVGAGTVVVVDVDVVVEVEVVVTVGGVGWRLTIGACVALGASLRPSWPIQARSRARAVVAPITKRVMDMIASSTVGSSVGCGRSTDSPG